MPGKARLVTSALVVLLAAGAVGCVRAHAKAPPEVPPLDVPAPPARVVETVDVDQPPPAALIEEPARHAEPSALRRPVTPPRPDPGREDPPKPEAGPPSTSTDSTRPAEEAKPPTTLQMPPAGGESEAERNVQVLLARATADLNRVNRRSLSAGARTQYEAAEGFVRQATDALRQRNLVFAMSLANKAAVLAAQLAGR